MIGSESGARPIESQYRQRPRKTNMKFSTALKSWRKKRKVSQSQAATQLGVSIRTLQSWEIEAREPHEITQIELKRRMK